MSRNFPQFALMLRSFGAWYVAWAAFFVWVAIQPKTPSRGFAVMVMNYVWCHGTVWPEFVFGILSITVFRPVLMSAGVTRAQLVRDTALWALFATCTFAAARGVFALQDIYPPWEYGAVGALGKATGVFTGQLCALTFVRWPRKVAVPLLLVTTPAVTTIARDVLGVAIPWGAAIAVYAVLAATQVGAWWWIQRTPAQGRAASLSAS